MPKVVIRGAVGEVPQHAHVRVARASVVEDDRRLGEQARDEEVPHHPAGCREPEHAVAGLRVDVQVEHLEVLEQDPALALHDRLRKARRPGGVQDPQRVVEGHGLELEVAAGIVGPARAVEVAQREDVPAGLGGDALDGLAAVEVAPVVAVAVDRQQHLRLDLGEAVDHRTRPEVRRAARPDGADRRRGQEAGHRLRDVRHVGGHPVALLDAERAQPRRHARRLPAQLAPRPLAQLAQLGGVDDRHRAVVLAAEQVLGVVDPRAREPLGARHLRRGQHVVIAALDAEEVPDRGPEAVEVLDRPAPQLVVAPVAALAHEAGHQRALHPLGRRLPQQRRHGAP